MRTVILWLLVIVSGSCLLSTDASATYSQDFEEVQPFDSWIKAVENALHKALTTVQGVNCTIKEVINVMIAATNYVDAIEACSTDVPKDVAKIVKSCKDIIQICDDIIHLHSTICAEDEDGKTSALSCSWHLFTAIMKMTRKMNTTLKLIAKLPVDTEACFYDATKQVEKSFNDFLPRVEICIDQM